MMDGFCGAPPTGERSRRNAMWKAKPAACRGLGSNCVMEPRTEAVCAAPCGRGAVPAHVLSFRRPNRVSKKDTASQKQRNSMGKSTAITGRKRF